MGLRQSQPASEQLPPVEKVQAATRLRTVRDFEPSPSGQPPAGKKTDTGERLVDPRMAIATYEHVERGLPERHRVLRAEEVMSAPVVTVAPDTSSDDARALICKYRFRHVPVCSEAGDLVGMISDRDLLREAARVLQAAPGGEDEALGSVAVRDFMQTDVLSASPDRGIREIAHALYEERTGAIPIVDADGALVGIVTRSDILRAVVKHAPLELWI